MKRLWRRIIRPDLPPEQEIRKGGIGHNEVIPSIVVMTPQGLRVLNTTLSEYMSLMPYTSSNPETGNYETNDEYEQRILQMIENNIPGWEGSVGPFPQQYSKPHVYARDIHSGAGNCVCGLDLAHKLHVQAAPGIPIPERMRS